MVYFGGILRCIYLFVEKVGHLNNVKSHLWIPDFLFKFTSTTTFNYHVSDNQEKRAPETTTQAGKEYDNTT